MSEQDELLQESAGDAQSSALHDAIGAAGRALMALLVALLTLLFRALQAAFTLARLALPVGAAALQGFGSALLFGAVVVAYGNDLPALLLALAAVVVLPVGLLLYARKSIGIWGVLVASGALSLLAREAIARSPPTLLGALPGLGLLACIYYLAFGAKSPDAPDNPVGIANDGLCRRGNERTVEDEREQRW